MEESGALSFPSDISGNATSHDFGRVNSNGSGFPGLKKRCNAYGSHSWIKIDQSGNSIILELDKATVMRNCSLPARDLRLLDPLFIYPSSILGREKAIVVSIEQIRCIITSDEVIMVNSLDSSVDQYKSELCQRLQTNTDQSDDLPFEFRALELALELTCISLDAQVNELEKEIYPVLEELASFISTFNLDRVRRFKGHLITLTQQVQKVCDDIVRLMHDDSDMAEMYLTEKQQRKKGYRKNGARAISKSAPVSSVGSISGAQKLKRDCLSLSSSKHSSSIGSSYSGENIVQLEMLLEAYFVVIDNILNKLLSLKEFIDDTENLIKTKLCNVRNQLIQFRLLFVAASFVMMIFAAVTGIMGMKFQTTIFNYWYLFYWVLTITGLFCGMLYASFLIYLRHTKILR